MPVFALIGCVVAVAVAGVNVWPAVSRGLQTAPTANAPVVQTETTVFEVFTDVAGEHRFRLIDQNRKVLLKSQPYPAERSMRTGISSVMTNAPIDRRYERKLSADGRHFFNLKAGNGKTIGTSTLYAEQSEMEAVLAAVKTGAATALVVDEEAEEPAPSVSVAAVTTKLRLYERETLTVCDGTSIMLREVWQAPDGRPREDVTVGVPGGAVAKVTVGQPYEISHGCPVELIQTGSGLRGRWAEFVVPAIEEGS